MNPSRVPNQGWMYACTRAMAVLYVGCVSATALGDVTPSNVVRSIDEEYAEYKPNFLQAQPAELMINSVQPTFYNRSYVPQDKRADALIREGLKQEAQGQYRDAIQHYQKVLEKFPDEFVQVSEYGIFLSVELFVQRRILAFPKKELDYYRLLYNPPAQEIYERALARHSVEDLHEVADMFLATSYGAKALQALGKKHDKGLVEIFDKAIEKCNLTNDDIYLYKAV